MNVYRADMDMARFLFWNFFYCNCGTGGRKGIIIVDVSNTIPMVIVFIMIEKF